MKQPQGTRTCALPGFTAAKKMRESTEISLSYSNPKGGKCSASLARAPSSSAAPCRGSAFLHVTLPGVTACFKCHWLISVAATL